jgi:hypothetical protein
MLTLYVNYFNGVFEYYDANGESCVHSAQGSYQERVSDGPGNLSISTF